MTNESNTKTPTTSAQAGQSNTSGQNSNTAAQSGQNQDQARKDQTAADQSKVGGDNKDMKSGVKA